MTFLYANAITTLVTPDGVPIVYGSYGVEPGVTGNALTSNDIYYVSGLDEATQKCDNDSRCVLFYFDGRSMSYLNNDGVRYGGQPGGIYRRQIPLTSS